MAQLKDSIVTGSLRVTDTIYSTLLNVTGPVIFSSTTDASGIEAHDAALIIGDKGGAHLEFDTNEIMSKASGTTTRDLHLNADGSAVIINANVAAAN